MVQGSAKAELTLIPHLISCRLYWSEGRVYAPLGWAVWEAGQSVSPSKEQF